MERTSISVSQLELRDYIASQRSLRRINGRFSTCDSRLCIFLSIRIDVFPQIAILCLRCTADEREVQAISVVAHAAGVAWSLPAAQKTLLLDMSHDGTCAVSAGRDGVVRVHDLLRRTTRPVLDLRAPGDGAVRRR
jgi:hypothetical protein